MSEKQKEYVTWTIFIWAIGILILAMGWVRLDTTDVTAKATTKMDQYIQKEDKTQETLSEIKSNLSSISTDLKWIKQSNIKK